MASIRKRGPYQYQVEIRRKGYSPLCKTFETRGEAEAWASEMERTIDAGMEIPAKHYINMTLQAALERYLEEVSSQKSDHKAELRRVKMWLKHPYAKRSVVKITGRDIADYISGRRKVIITRNGVTKHLSDSTIRLEVTLISHLYSIMRKRWGFKDLHNPVSDIEMPKASKGRVRRLVKDEEVRLLHAAEAVRSGTPWLVYAVRLAILTGVRAGELLGMKWEHVHLDERLIHLPITKNKESRDVPLSKEAMELLLEMQHLPRKREHKVVDAWGGSVNLSHEFKKAADQAGIKNLTFHDLRHEAATRMAKKLKPHELAKALGWKTLQMVMRYYHPTALELAEK